MSQDDDRDAVLRELLHEARTPLLALATAIDLVEPSPESALAATALAHLHELFARAEARVSGSPPPTSSPVPLVAVAAEVAVLVAPALAGQQLGLRVDVGDLWVVADSLALRQILVNLVSNASRFAPPGTEVVLAASVDAGRVVVEVRDEGAGVDAGEADWIFERGATSAVDEVHVGLGLYLSRQLAESMGATLTLRPVDVGACFRLDLPLPAVAA